MKKRLLCLCLVLSIVAGLLSLAPVAAASDMKASDSCLNLIKEFEGFSGKPYRDTDGLYTIGYGTRCPNDKVAYYRENPMTQEEAEVELRKEIVTYEKAVNAFIDRHGVTFSQQQFDAVVSLVYNVGVSWLTKGNTLINALADGATGNELIYAFTIYSLSGGNRSVGHIRRRLAEANAYLNGVYSRTLPENLAYVLYDGRGGTVSSYDVQGYDKELTAVPMVTASRTGYIFKGWFTQATGGELVTVLDASTKDMTLFAHWESVTGEEELPPEQEGFGSVTVTGDDVNIRRGPGLSYAVVGQVDEGEELTITDIMDNDGYTWGQFDKGWIALEYTDYFDRPSTPAPCDHEYTVVSEKAPTCTAAGTTVYACTVCDDVYSTILPATGHDYAGQTCTQPQTCKICGHATGTALGHSYADASCTEAAKCTVCGQTSGSPIGHSYADATCTSPAKCTRCGQTSGSALDHNYTAASCTTPAKCTRCGQTSGSALGHSYTEATCNEPKKCKTCGTTSGTGLGHSYGDDGLCTRCDVKNPNFKGPTVTVTANKVNLRSGAGLSYKTVGSVNTGARLTITETKQKDGYLWGKSDRGWIALKYTNYNQLAPKPCQHQYEVTGKVEATCTAQGSVTYTCKLCKESYKEPVAAKAHTYQAATCTTAKTCKVCGATSGNALGHSYSEATCTAARTCTACGITNGQALGHKYGTDGLCDRCNAKNPNYKEPEESKPVTVTKTYGTVIKTNTLNVRKTPDGTAVGVLRKGDKVEILEQKTVNGRLWGRCSKGWICMRTYVKLETVTETIGGISQPTTPQPEPKPENPSTNTVTKTYATVINTDSLNIRVTPNGKIVGTLNRGDRVEILEKKSVSGKMWGRCSKGWIFIHSYGKLETVQEPASSNPPATPPTTTQTGTVTASALNVRANAGTNYAVVDLLYKGATVKILEKKTVNGTTWARIEQGWVSMAYIK